MAESENEGDPVLRASITQAEMEDIMYTLEKDHEEALRLKKQNSILRKKLDGVIENNQKMAKIIGALDKKMHGTTLKPRDKLIYSFQEGAMIGKEFSRKHILELKKKHVTIKQINEQLNELVAMVESKKK